MPTAHFVLDLLMDFVFGWFSFSDNMLIFYPFAVIFFTCAVLVVVRLLRGFSRA